MRADFLWAAETTMCFELATYVDTMSSLPPYQLVKNMAPAHRLASQVKRLFPNLWFGLLVGIATGLPNHSRNPPLDIRLGDVLVGLATDESAGLIAYDLGKETGGDGFQLIRSGHVLANTETVVRSAIGNIKLRAPNETSSFLPYYESIMHKLTQTAHFSIPGKIKIVSITLMMITEFSTYSSENRLQGSVSRRTRVWYGSIGSGDKLVKNP
jgi:hypothetical protein